MLANCLQFTSQKDVQERYEQRHVNDEPTFCVTRIKMKAAAAENRTPGEQRKMKLQAIHGYNFIKHSAPSTPRTKATVNSCQSSSKVSQKINLDEFEMLMSKQNNSDINQTMTGRRQIKLFANTKKAKTATNSPIRLNGKEPA